MKKEITKELMSLGEQSLKMISLPYDIYALLIKDDNDTEHLISIKHNGYCPNITNEREQSNYNDYLSNLEYSVVQEFFRFNKIKSKSYNIIKELLTDSKGKIFHYSYSN